MVWRKMRRKRGDQQQLGGNRGTELEDWYEEVENNSSLKLYKIVKEKSGPEICEFMEGHMAVRLWF